MTDSERNLSERTRSASTTAARLDAEEARRSHEAPNGAGSARPRSIIFPGPGQEFAMPECVMQSTNKINNWSFDICIHNRFAYYCRCAGNSTLSETTSVVRETAPIGFTRYFESLGKLKSLKQRRTRLITAQCLKNTVFATKSIRNCGRLLALKFIMDTLPGEPFSADPQQQRDEVPNEAAIKHLT